ncbi:MAG: tetratricopeptide repeat protein [Campylobacterota bacterium]|nr:tetratricopeptide repeat protein [Campylobacterota bacterium]
MKKIILVISIYNLGFGSIFDFDYINKANIAYEKKDYETSSKYFGMVNSDEALFNKGDSLYREKKYEEALESYTSIKDKSLQFKKLYNMGNSYAHLNKIDEAINSYEEALKIKDDSDAKYNLELLKKQKDKQNQNKDKNKEDSNKDNKEQKDSNSNDEAKDDKESQENKEQKDKEQKDKEESKKAKENKSQENKKDEVKEMPISDMEERKWQNSLNNRGVNTLMLPIGKGENDNETKPW